MSLLEIRDIRAGYGKGADILRGLDLTVEAGEIKCVIGPNGAGKSTLLKVISGLLKPRDGSIKLKGEELAGKRADQILGAGIAFIPQERSLFPDMTVRENLRIGGYILRDNKLIDERVEEVFEQFPILKERSRQRAKTLSGGQQQMLAMGRTLVLKPDIVLLDEPSLGLAPKIVQQVFDMVAELRDTGMTIILVEQNALRGLEAADTGCVLDLGKTLFEDDADRVLADPRIQELYLGNRGQREKTA